MTKSGVGTTMLAQNQSLTTSSSNSTATTTTTVPEIPIWVSDKKKWVTGISKKTTINDIIYAILKQCNINCDLELINDYVLFEIIYCLNTITANDTLSSSENFKINSERILKGQSKVYKYLSKWSENSNKLMLKVKKCEFVNQQPQTQASIDDLMENGSNTTTLTKLLKKFSVNKQPQTSGVQSSTLASNSTSIQSQLNNNKFSIRYVDVKLPQQQQQQQQTNRITSDDSAQTQPIRKHPSAYVIQQQHVGADESTTTTSQLPYKQYDPMLQKSLIVTTILDKDKKLNQQIEKVNLIDELIKEAEKTLNFNENYYLTHQINTLSSPQPLPTHSNQMVDINLADVYQNFPEMFTHNASEVKEFTDMCLKLFNLDENLSKQATVLTKLENELQIELNLNQNQLTSYLFEQNELLNTHLTTCIIDTPETVKLKKEVGISREKTRIQCKELHDLDLHMRQNESLLIHKENALKRLLEELYLQEVYSDTLMNSNQQSNSYLDNLNNSGDSYEIKISDSGEYSTNINGSLQKAICTSTSSSSATNSKLKTLNINKLNDQCDNDSGISSMSSENDQNNKNLLLHQQSSPNQQQGVKSVMETLV